MSRFFKAPVSPLVVVSTLLMSRHPKTCSKAHPGDVPTLHMLRSWSVCLETVGSLQQQLESSPIPSSSCAGQWNLTVMEECDHNWAKQCHQDVFLGVTSPMTLVTPMVPLTALHCWLFWCWVVCEQHCSEAWEKGWSGRARIWQRLDLKWVKVINSVDLSLFVKQWNPNPTDVIF